MLAKAIQHAHCSSASLQTTMSKTHSVPIMGPRTLQGSVMRNKEIESSNMLLAKRLDTIHNKTSALNTYQRLPDLKSKVTLQFSPSNSALIPPAAQDSGFSMELTCLASEVAVKVVWRCLDSQILIAEWNEQLQEGQTIVRKLPFRQIKDFESVCFEVEAIDAGKSRAS